MRLHIVHPTGYLMRDGVLYHSGAPQISDRAKTLIRFVDEIPPESRTVHRWYKTTFDMAVAMAVHKSPDLSEIFLAEPIFTSSDGLPRYDRKPTHVRDEAWNMVKDMVISDAEYKERFGQGPTIFIGGALERCLANIMFHHKTRIAPNEQVSYVPEVCYSTSAGDTAKVREALAVAGINAMTVAEAHEAFKKQP